MALICSYCGKEMIKTRAAIRRAQRRRTPLYCNIQCAGKAKIKYTTEKQRKAAVHRYYLTRKDRYPERVSAERKRWRENNKVEIARYHAKLCACPEYKEKKRGYDKRYRAERIFGKRYKESYLVFLDLDAEVRRQLRQSGARS